MNASPRLNVAIAGFGWWGQHMVRRLKDNEKISVAAVIEPDPARHAEIAAHDLRHLVDFDLALAQCTRRRWCARQRPANMFSVKSRWA